jgi:ribonuclease P protein component
VLRRSHFSYLMRQGRHFSGSEIRVEYRRQSKTLSPKLGITVSRRYGKAHERNRFKRVVREAFRELYPTLPKDLELHISPKKPRTDLTMMAILLDLKGFLEKIIYCDRSNCVHFDSARRDKAKSKRSGPNEEDHSRLGRLIYEPIP